MRATIKNTLPVVAVILMFCGALFSRCAHQAMPQGGPKDSLPPMVVEAIPIYGATNFNGKRITINFDEYVQLKDQQKNFFMSPFPAKKPTLTIKNRGIVIDLKSPLDSGVTYSLNFGNSVADNNEGNIIKGLSYVFSTGAKLDSMVMTGFTYNAYSLDTLPNAFVMFYDAKADSVPEKDSLLYIGKELSVGRTAENGVFIRDYIKPIDYRVYAFFDNNGNQKYERGIDLVGFLPNTYNPKQMPEVSIWEDTAGFRTADPQLFFRLFKEKPIKRQNISDVTREHRNRLTLSFNAPFPQIDTLELQGIDKSAIIYEYLKTTHDSIALWINKPLIEIPDTIKGRIVFQKTDSVGKLHPFSYEIKSHFFEKKVKEKDKEKKEGDKPEPNPFKYKVDASQSIIPDNNIPITFDYPLVAANYQRISLEVFGKNDQLSKVKFSLDRDTMNIRRWVINAPWEGGAKYKLLIPSGTFENILGEKNDTLKADFEVANLNKFATFVLNIKNSKPDTEYIVQIVDRKSKALKVEKEIAHVRDGELKIDYIDPGTKAIRIIEDANRNGIWDTGDLVQRQQPEQVRMYVSPNGNPSIISKANWEVEFDIDLVSVFTPFKVSKTHIMEAEKALKPAMEHRAPIGKYNKKQNEKKSETK